jgi:hypothetical protein
MEVELELHEDSVDLLFCLEVSEELAGSAKNLKCRVVHAVDDVLQNLVRELGQTFDGTWMLLGRGRSFGSLLLGGPFWRHDDLKVLSQCGDRSAKTQQHTLEDAERCPMMISAD